MTPHEFWHEDVRLLKARKIAYERNLYYTAWVFGQHNHIGNEIALSNAFLPRGKQKQTYIKFQDPIKQLEKPVITKENLEIEFRKQQARQQSWLHNILHKKG